MITVVDYKPDHLERIVVKSCHNGEKPNSVSTRAITIMNGETPIAIIGSFLFVPGVMHIWALVSDEVKKVPVEFFKTCVKLREYFEFRDKPRRMQMDIREGHPELEKFAIKIGFKREGLMKAFGSDGSDFWMFGRAC